MLLEEACPLGSLNATVEGTDRSAYLFAEAGWDTDVRLRALWLVNHGRAPSQDDDLPPADDNAPAPPLPAWAVRRRDGEPALDRSQLRLVWEPGGDGCAVLQGDEPLGWMPSATTWDFDHPGYAAAAVTDHPRARALGAVRGDLDRWLQSAETFWSFHHGAAWGDLQARAGVHLATRLGPRAATWAVDGDVWPPCIATQHRTDASTFVTATVGMALQPQPGTDAGQRIELAVATPTAGGGAGALLGQLCRSPWASLRALRHGDVLPISPTAAPDGWARFAAAVVVDPAVAGPGRILGMPDLGGLRTLDDATVRHLWLLGVTAAEAGGGTAAMAALGLA